MAEQETTIENMQLVTIQGGVITIEYPDSIMDELMDDFRESSKRQDYWNVSNWCDAKATFKGIRLDEIDMAKVIGVVY